MGLDFDLQTFCTNLKATKPPYECPVRGCGKVYKSYSGIHFHLLNYDHDNPDNVTTPNKKPSKKGGRKGGGATPGRKRSPSPCEFPRSPKQMETLTYAEAQRMVEIEVDGRIHRLNIFEPLEIISQDEIDNCDNTEKEKKEEKPKVGEGSKSPLRGKDTKKGKVQKDSNQPSNPSAPVKLPEANFKVLDDWVRPAQAPKRSTAYYRFIEKTADELDEDVEYDMDEEDCAWLDVVNVARKKESLQNVAQETFEFLMDRFEKEAFFQSQTSGTDTAPPIDEDAVCSICMDGECQNSNVILFCDMCNLPVHQECYGVPYIPEGQWLCRRCLQSPSRAVDCCLCPNKGGAFKQTDDNRWAHVVCALWIPEVGFANTVFLEPIDCLERIPAARWKLTCYICKQRGTGACIQCHRTNCYTAFHVTCAQQAGLFMKIEPVRESSGLTVSVRKTAFCDVHAPPNTTFLPMIDNGVDSDDENRNTQLSPADVKAQSRMKMRKARKILAEKRNAVPIVSIPIIPQPRLSKISAKVSMSKKQQFIARLQSYWTLKRQSRNGVPLLRRLQSSHMSKSRGDQKTDQQSQALKEQLKYWQRLRQDLEKARLLVELIRKREKLKREQLRLHQMATEMRLTPFLMLLRHTLDQLQEKDPQEIFASPVDLDEVPDYMSYIKTPMDFSTMRKKMEGHQYSTVEEFEGDFDLVVNNCMLYNAKDTSFYRAAVKLRDLGGAIIRQTKRMAERIGFEKESGLLTEAPPKVEDVNVLDDIEEVLAGKARHLPLEEQLNILLDRLDAANQSHHRSRLARKIKKEIVSVRRGLAIQKGQTFFSDHEDSVNTASDTEEEVKPPPRPAPRPAPRRPGRPPRPVLQEEPKEEPAEPAAKSEAPEEEEERRETSAPPSGVNRRTAVLFSKKRRGQDAGAATPTKCPSMAATTPVPPPPASKPLGRPPKVASSARGRKARGGRDEEEDADDKVDAAATTAEGALPPRGGGRKRTNSGTCADSPAPKRQAVAGDAGGGGEPATTFGGKESFTTYRSLGQLYESELDSTSGSLSSTATSGSSDDDDSDDDDSDPERKKKKEPSSPAAAAAPSTPSRAAAAVLRTPGSKRKPARPPPSTPNQPSILRFFARNESAGDGVSETDSTSGRARSSSCCSDSGDLHPLEALDLVWAKCQGYPWYPALIINPKMPKTGYLHNGVPIPVPPQEVLELQPEDSLPGNTHYLVLFFDAKRTWQWLPRPKLEALGVDPALDKIKLLENKKPNVRKAVKKAHDKALLHRCRVSGTEPVPPPAQPDDDTAAEHTD